MYILNIHRENTQFLNYLHAAEIPSLLWNPEFHYHINNSLLLVPILSQMEPCHMLILPAI
jgi:hypothetical protein